MQTKFSKKTSITVIALILIVAVAGALAYYAYKETKSYETAMENKYNMAFYELIDYCQNVETYLAKSVISNNNEQGAKTLTHLWREASLAQSYLSSLPIASNELSNTSKFFNQVSDYAYTLSQKNISGEKLSQEELDNLKNLHSYSVEIENVLNQLSTDLNDGRIKWKNLEDSGMSNMFSAEVSSITLDSFTSLEENFHEYSGLIYDGAFSDHLTSSEKKGLTGEDFDEEQAKQQVEKFYGEDKIEEIITDGYSENAEIPCYYFSVKLKQIDSKFTISVSKKGGHIISSNYNRDVNVENISNEQANDIGKSFLEEHGYPNMKETYYLKQNGILTINYAYEKAINDNEKIVIYPDLIKLKIALDDGEVLGIETTGYLNSHNERTIETNIIDSEKAKEQINPNVEILSTNLAIIPTEWKTEILCWEFKGKVDDNEFLVYINAENEKVEDILVIVNTPNGTLTH